MGTTVPINPGVIDTASSNRSSYLSIIRASDENGQALSEVEYEGFDDKDNDDPSDDEHIYIIRSYVLKDSSNKAALDGQIWLYDENMDRVVDSESNPVSWDVASLECVTHEAQDGLQASSSGIQHALRVPVLASLMEDDKDYIFVMRMRDNHATDYRDHTVRWAKDLNQVTPAITYTVSSFPDGTGTVGHPGYIWMDEGPANTKFFVLLLAKAFFPVGRRHPDTIEFTLKRNGDTHSPCAKKGYVITSAADYDDHPVDVYVNGHKTGTIYTYRTYVAQSEIPGNDWIITTWRGRWCITARKSNVLQYKIDKRAQIVKTAQAWIGTDLSSRGLLCNGFAQLVYNQVGLDVGHYQSEQMANTVEDGGQGALVFYGITENGAFTSRHVGIGTGSDVIDINCGRIQPNGPHTGTGLDVRQHDESLAKYGTHPDQLSPSRTMPIVRALDSE